MPKELKKIEDFSGGVNTYAEPQNLKDDELAHSSGFKSEKGELVVLGDMKAAYTIGNGDTQSIIGHNIDVEAGYGLFTFSHDYNKDGDLVNTNYYILMSRLSSNSNNKFDIYDDVSHEWRDDQIDLGGSSSDTRMDSIKPCFVFVDGTLRISPGDFGKKDSGGNLGGAIVPAQIFEYGDVHNLDPGYLPSQVADGDTFEASKAEFLCIDSSEDIVARNMHGLFEVTTGGSGTDVYIRPDTRWYGIVKRRLFQGITTIGSFTAWYSTFMHPRPPVDPLNFDYPPEVIPFAHDYSNGDHTFDTYVPRVHIGDKYDNANTSATWDSTYQLWITALYDESKQESQPNALRNIDITAGNELAIWVGVHYSNTNFPYEMNKRVTGSRIYWEDTVDEPGVLYQLLEIDFEEGCKKVASQKFTPWVEWNTAHQGAACPHADGATATNRTSSTNAFIFDVPPRLFTYEINNGYPVNTNTHARFKTATVAGRRLYAGNVYQGGKAYGDRILYSPVNKFDLLPETNVLDLAVGDGDEIVKLESFADRILEFKKRTLYILNVGGGVLSAFIESQHANMGVENPSQVCKMEFGIAWVNKFGVFAYNGQQVTELTQGKLQMSNSTRGLGLNIRESYVPSIGYHSLKKWLVIHVESAVDDYDVEAWIFDFKNGSWTWSQEFSTTDKLKTNMINTHDNELVFASGAAGSRLNFLKLQDTGASDPAIGKLFLLTKDFTLDVPSVKKNLYSIYITYSASGNTQIEGDIIYKHATGETIEPLIEANSGTTYYTETLGLKSTSGSIVTVELVPKTAIKNANSFQLKLHNRDVAHDSTYAFKLYSVSFRYRMKGIR